MNVWVGYDTREHDAFEVCRYSIHKHRPEVEVHAIEQKNMRLLGLYTRPVDDLASTEFSLTRVSYSCPIRIQGVVTLL